MTTTTHAPADLGLDPELRSQAGRVDLTAIATATVVIVLVLGTLEFHGSFLVRHWGPIAAFVLMVIATRGARLSPGPTATLVLTLWAYATWSLASALWAASPALALEDGLRNCLYAALLTLAVAGCNSPRGAMAVAKLAVGGLAVVVAATFTELLVTGTDALVAGRLSEPVGYRNGTAALLAIAVFPMLNVSAARSAPLAVRAATFPLGVMALALAFMTQSRGLFIGVAAGAVVSIGLGPDRLRRSLVGVLGIACVGIASSALLAPYDSFIAERRFSNADVDRAVIALVVIAIGGALSMLAFTVFDRGLRATAFATTARHAGLVVACVILALAVTGGVVMTGDPVSAARGKVDEFRSLETAHNSNRLGSTGGPRADLWGIALDEFAAQPVTGIGEGSYHVAYYEHRGTDRNVTDPHSLPMAVLAETGLIGIGLILAALVAAIRALASGWRRADQAARRWASALAAAATTLIAQASIDWLWAIPGLTGLALLCLGLAIAVLADPAAPATRVRWTIGTDASLRAAAAIAAVAVVALVASDAYTREAVSHQRGSATKQLDAARQAHAFNPWALRPRYLAAGALERMDRRKDARRELRAALRQEPRNFVTLTLLGDLEMRAQRPRAARAWYRRALALNPRDAGLQRLAH